MQIQKSPFVKYIFVCENKREEGACCLPAGSELREALKKNVKEMGLASKIRVSKAGCLDVCSDGPNVLLMPDNVWFSHVSDADIQKIIQKAVEGL